MPNTTAVQDEASSAITPKKRKRVTTNSESILNVDEDGPACICCRKRKTKCNREQPCSQCTRLNLSCTYDDTREPTGVKTGAIESLNQRLSMLEHMFLGQGLLLEPLLKDLLPAGILRSDESVQSRADALRQQYHHVADLSTSGNHTKAVPSQHLTENDFLQPQESTSEPQFCVPDNLLLPPLHVLHDLVELYYVHVHPWIPVLHVTSFREQLVTQGQREKIVTILQAITSACLRFEQTSGLTWEQKEEWSLNCRKTVILTGMERFSVTNLQAMVIVSFDIIAGGKGPSSWSLIGSMARTVEQLQLSIEDSDQAQEHPSSIFMIRRMKFLNKSNSWREAEEHRRLFWCIFLLDRFCSVATGWNNSLTGVDIRRRLPCEGAIWQKGEPVTTPWFGISENTGRPESALTPSSERHGVDDDHLASIGGFAFCIEATENLNLVTKFVLQQPLKPNDKRSLDIWLFKFRELDLRLFRWRTFLPSKWRNACALNQDGIMDPNLTLAHITHNTAVIQLHQAIAYQPTQPSQSPELPFKQSAETCVAAAQEISLIASQFLAQSNAITNPQFSFCAFIAGRALLAHARFCSELVDKALDSLIDALGEMARRLPTETKTLKRSSQTLATQFEMRLREAKLELECGRLTANSPSTKRLDTRQAVYSDHPDNDLNEEVTTTASESASYGKPLSSTVQGQEMLLSGIDFNSPDSVSLAFPPLPAALEDPFLHRLIGSDRPTLATTPASLPTESFLDHTASQSNSMELVGSDAFWNVYGENWPHNCTIISTYGKIPP